MIFTRGKGGRTPWTPDHRWIRPWPLCKVCETIECKIRDVRYGREAEEINRCQEYYKAALSLMVISSQLLLESSGG